MRFLRFCKILNFKKISDILFPSLQNFRFIYFVFAFFFFFFFLRLCFVIKKSRIWFDLLLLIRSRHFFLNILANIIIFNIWSFWIFDFFIICCCTIFTNYLFFLVQFYFPFFFFNIFFYEIHYRICTYVELIFFLIFFTI